MTNDQQYDIMVTASRIVRWPSGTKNFSSEQKNQSTKFQTEFISEYKFLD